MSDPSPERIWKFVLPIGAELVAVTMPIHARLLGLHVVRKAHAEEICLWAIVDPGRIVDRRYFRVRGTGHLLGDQIGKFVGTAVLASGALVLHVFDQGYDCDGSKG